MGLVLRGVGYGSALTAVGRVAPVAHGNRVVYSHPGVSEWYINGPRGLEQGFTVTRSPERSERGPLTLSMGLSGNLHASLIAAAHGLALSRADKLMLRYSGLAATDARGHKLRAWLQLDGRELDLRVDTRGAAYPLRIDPLIQQGEAQTLVSGEETALCVNPEGFEPGTSGSIDYAGLDTEHSGPFPDGGPACAQAFPAHAVARTGPGHPGQEGGPGDPAWPYTGKIAGASWVSINAAGEDFSNTPPRYYIYYTTFELCSDQLEGTEVRGAMLADDAVGAFLNGTPIGHQTGPNSAERGFPDQDGSPMPISYGPSASGPGAFQAGVNTLQFVVLDEAGALTGVDFAATVTPARACRQEPKEPPENEARPANTELPAITGNGQVGDELSCATGVWTGGATLAYTYQWLRDGSAIAGATGASYTVEGVDEGHTLTCTVTASDGAGEQPATSVGVTVALPPPVAFHTANLVLVSGVVLVELPRTHTFVPLSAATSVPLGTVVNATYGKVRLISAKDSDGHTETGLFYGGIFRIGQVRPRSGALRRQGLLLTVVTLVGPAPSGCRSGDVAPAEDARRRPRIRNRVVSSAEDTKVAGRDAAGIVEDPRWLTEETCAGTLIRVFSGTVSVEDFPHHRTFLLRAPRSFLVHPGAGG
jgi:hypothetical protein